MYEQGVAFRIEPEEQSFQVALRHGSAPDRALVMAMPNMEKDARAASQLRRIVVSRDGVIVIYNDPPAVRLTSFSHMF